MIVVKRVNKSSTHHDNHVKIRIVRSMTVYLLFYLPLRLRLIYLLFLSIFEMKSFN